MHDHAHAQVITVAGSDLPIGLRASPPPPAPSAQAALELLVASARDYISNATNASE